MIRILSADLLIADIIIPRDDNPTLKTLVEAHTLKPGSKQALDIRGLHEFYAAIEGRYVEIMPGGSSANMLTTLGKLNKEARIQLLGIAGEGKHGDVIRRALAEAGIALLPPVAPPGPAPHAAVSFVVVQGGQCAIATYPGNARELVRPEMISESLVAGNDIVLMQGSLWHKFGPAFADRLFDLRRRFGKELWLTLPTQAALSQAGIAHFKTLIPSADLLLGNEDELTRLFPGTPESALFSLQVMLPRRKPAPVAFITGGRKGATVITPDDVEYVPPLAIADREIINTLGAGDTAYAGFAAGRLGKLLPAECARLAMALAGAKLKVNAPRLANPLEALAESSPELARSLPRTRV